MKKTDYGKVSERYDDNPDRHRIPPDATVAALLGVTSTRGAPLAVLDLACGTGNWLAVQTAAFAGREVVWSGLDASEAMLGRARTKLQNVALTLGRAESLPYADGTFDYVFTSFAFHHFEDKPRALDEIRRVLARGGVLQIVNVAPTHMRLWWVYRRFWQAYAEDEARFWSPERLFHELERRDFEPIVAVDYRFARLPVARVAEDIERRDISQLAILPDAEYERGLAQVRADLAAEPDRRDVSEIAVLACTARLRTVQSPAV